MSPSARRPQFKQLGGPGPARDLIGYGRWVPRVTWPNGARVAVSIVLNWEEGSEVSKVVEGDGRSEAALGEIPYAMDPQYRDLAVESVYEYGSRAGVWRVQRLIDSFKIPVTFYGAAVAWELNPEVGGLGARGGPRAVLARLALGGAVAAHARGGAGAHAEAVASIERTCGERPRGWYCRYGPSVNTRELLVEDGGFVYDSDAYNDDLPYYVEVAGKRHLIVPYSFTYNDAQVRAAPGLRRTRTDFFDQCRRGLDYLWDEGATHPRMMSIGLHSRLIGQAGRISALRDFLEYAHEKGDVWFAPQARHRRTGGTSTARSSRRAADVEPQRPVRRGS